MISICKHREMLRDKGSHGLELSEPANVRAQRRWRLQREVQVYPRTHGGFFGMEAESRHSIASRDSSSLSGLLVKRLPPELPWREFRPFEFRPGELRMEAAAQAAIRSGRSPRRPALTPTAPSSRCARRRLSLRASSIAPARERAASSRRSLPTSSGNEPNTYRFIAARTLAHSTAMPCHRFGYLALTSGDG
jgi:hypothetical protein